MELFGVRIRIHPTFVWLLLFVYLFSGARSLEWLLVVFAFVVLHELSHSLVAKAHGIQVRDITLLPIGGVARLGDMPENAATEFKIAIAGPALNFVVAGLLFLLSEQGVTPFHAARGVLIGPPFRIEQVGVETIWYKMFVANLLLGGFNLLPAFPMDGGRLLRAFLATGHGWLRATQIAARVGRWIAAVMAALSLFTLLSPDMHWQWGLLIIAVFIYVSGKREEMAVTLRHTSRGVWRLLGFGPEPGYPPLGTHGDVIDVEGHVRPKDQPDTAAADAFRRLAEDNDPPPPK